MKIILTAALLASWVVIGWQQLDKIVNEAVTDEAYVIARDAIDIAKHYRNKLTSCQGTL